MRMIATHDGVTFNSEIIAMIQPVFISSRSYEILDNLDDETDYDDIEFGILATTTFGEEFVLGSYGTEEERDYAKYKLENWLTSEFSSYYKMTDRK